MNAAFQIRPRSLLRLIGLSLLVMAAAACGPVPVPAPAPTPTPANSIQGIVWQWTSVTNKTTQKTTTISNPASYTIIFNADGTLTGKADCNSFSGTYSQAGGFSIKLTSSTTASCGEGSLDQEYTTLLSNVAAGGPDGQGGLALETPGGEQRMAFKNGGPAPK